ncbi:MAG TPA: LysM peptidoglycan-binding domain-containing protein [Candidatus Dormibacteraeota bacterium]|nr:LysM peptidoglycan-binding domain-containing protein [Candidatus Dormibacteraeota bacterium]
MKRISFLLLSAALVSSAPTRAEDAATEERLNQLNGKIEDLIAGQETQRKRIAELSKELESVREQAGKPTGNYAAQDDLKRLGEAVKEVDRKRLEDYDKIHSDLLKLAKTLNAPPPKSNKTATSAVDNPVADKGSADKSGDKSSTLDKGVYEYVVQSGDTLDAIVQAYKQKNIKITVAQIKQANPGLVPEKMRVGQKLVIPAP